MLFEHFNSRSLTLSYFFTALMPNLFSFHNRSRFSSSVPRSSADFASAIESSIIRRYLFFELEETVISV